MVLYQRESNLSFSPSIVFNQLFNPGDEAPFGGIYKCTGCGAEIAIPKYHPLPLEGHHQHRSSLVPIGWHVIVHHQ
jgi:hypothetical protein